MTGPELPGPESAPDSPADGSEPDGQAEVTEELVDESSQETPEDIELVTVTVRPEGASAPEATGAVLEADPVCAAAVDEARAALPEPGLAGEHQGVVPEGPHLVTHMFQGSVPGYQGWNWAVTVVRLPEESAVTVDEVSLIPGEGALVAPTWIPWRNRLEPGDVRKGDVLVTEADDPSLVYGYEAGDTPEDSDQLSPEQWEVGLGRVRLLSAEGRRRAAKRWWSGSTGPSAVKSRRALRCGTCGFLLEIGGPLGQAFGVCANGLSKFDGRAVNLMFGCGAHSETQEPPSVDVAELIVDDFGFEEFVPLDAGDADAGADGDDAEGGEPADAPEEGAPTESEPTDAGAGDEAPEPDAAEGERSEPEPAVAGSVQESGSDPAEEES